MGRIVLHFEVERPDPITLRDDPNTTTFGDSIPELLSMSMDDNPVDDLVEKIHDFIDVIPAPEGHCLKGWWTDENGNLHMVSLHNEATWSD